MSHLPSPGPRYAPAPEPEPRQAPERAAAPTLAETPLTSTLIALNVLVFLVEIWLWWSSGAGRREPGSIVWNMSSVALLATGGNYWSATVHEGRFETLLASVFVHGGLLHIGFNMVALRQIGPFVERAVGTARMLPLYLLSGFIASFVSTFYHLFLRHDDSVGVGASGAICGLIGAALVIGGRVQGTRSPIMWAMIRWLGTIVVIGFALSGIDNAAHIGGAIAGVVIALLWRRGVTYSSARRALVIALSSLALVFTFGRVVERDLRTPWAVYSAAQRAAIAEALLERGDCEGALEAARAAERLRVTDDDVVGVVRRVRGACSLGM